MRIGELARELGISADTLRFYEREGWLPRPERAANGYRQYRSEEVEHLRLLLNLRRIDLPLEDASRLASWCHAGHCDATTTSLPGLIDRQRAHVRGRIAELREVDERLAELELHLRERGGLTVIAEATPCCSSAAAVFDAVAGACRCCASPEVARGS